MKIYNKEKTMILESCDLSTGCLKPDKITIHHEAVVGQEEKGHYETIREYPNGGKDVRWIVDVEGICAQPERDVEEDIYVYIPYTEHELKSQRTEKAIREKKQQLTKYKEDVEQVDLFGMQRSDYAEKKAKCASLILEIRNLEKQLK